MTKKICDRCGNDVAIPAFEEDRFPNVRLEIQRANYEPHKAVDLCIDCRDKLMKWLESGLPNTESI